MHIPNRYLLYINRYMTHSTKRLAWLKGGFPFERFPVDRHSFLLKNMHMMFNKHVQSCDYSENHVD